VKKNYFSLAKEGDVASLNIYGDICRYAWEEYGEMSAYNLSRQLEEMGDVKQINVYINSYGGEVAEGLAIYNALKRHKAKVTTYCDGFACSIASVIFMAGEERVMSESSMLMIHNAWTWASGNAEQLRKQADDLEKITQASVEAYKAHSSLSEEEIKALMDAETWILPEEALSYGFATKIEKTEKEKANQNALVKLFEIVKAYQAEEPEKADDEEANQKWNGFFNAILNLN
jgi:ATP-dependent Clp protease protease subunit